MLGMRTSLALPAILTILVSSVLISSSMTTADAAIFMKIDGIEGDVTVPGFEGAIELDSFQFSIAKDVSKIRGGSSDFVTSISDITITTTLSKASPAIFTEAVAGDAGISVTIDFVQNTQKGPFTFAKYLLTDTLISGYSVSASGGKEDSTPTETISLNFLKMEFSFFIPL